MGISSKNSSSKPLKIGEKFIGDAEKCGSWYSILISLRADTDCRITLEFSSDGKFWDSFATDTSIECIAYSKSFEIFSNYVHVIIENISNCSNQTFLKLRSTLRKESIVNTVANGAMTPQSSLVSVYGNDGTISKAIRTDANGVLQVDVISLPISIPFKILNATTISEQIGNDGTIHLCSVSAFNKSGADRYLKFYDDVIATHENIPSLTILLYPQSNYNINYTVPIQFLVGLCIRGTTGAADDDDGVPSKNDIIVNFTYMQ